MMKSIHKNSPRYAWNELGGYCQQSPRLPAVNCVLFYVLGNLQDSHGTTPMLHEYRNTAGTSLIETPLGPK